MEWLACTPRGGAEKGLGAGRKDVGRRAAPTDKGRQPHDLYDRVSPLFLIHP